MILVDANSIEQAAHWRAASTAYLEVLQVALPHSSSLSLEEAADLFVALHRFNGEEDDEDWITPLSHKLALSELSLFVIYLILTFVRLYD